MDAKYTQWWVRNTWTSSPTPCLWSTVFQGMSAPTGITALRQASLYYQRIKKLPTHLPPPLQVLYRDVAGTMAVGSMPIYSRSVFLVSHKHVQGIHPLDPFRLGAEDSRQTFFPDKQVLLLHWGASTGSVNRTPSEIIHIRELTSAWSWGTSGPVTYGKTLYDTWIWLTECLQKWHTLQWIAALSLSGQPYLKYASRFKHSLLLASLMSSTEIFGLQDKSLVKADWNMPSPVEFQLYRLVSFFGIQWLPKQDSTSC